MASKRTELCLLGAIDVPYSISDQKKTKFIESKDGKRFWQSPQGLAISAKSGVYVFAVRAGRGFRPIYIGKATRSFKSEVFKAHQIHHYNIALANTGKGTPCVFFICAPGSRKKVSRKLCGEIETFFIQLAVQKNPHLRNDRKTSLPEWVIAGLVRSKGKPSIAARDFAKMVGMG